MDELKILVDMVAHLPQMVLWVLAGYGFYKLAVIGSLYGLIRFCVGKLYDWAVTKKGETKEIVRLDGGAILVNCIGNHVYESLLTQVNRIKDRTRFGSIYIHASDVEWLRQAIDDKKAKDEAEKK